MKNIVNIPIVIMITGLLVLTNACEKSMDNISPLSVQPKYSVSTEDSLLCASIEDFLDALDDTPDDTCNFDTARYYLEASVNYHYGRANKAYGKSLIDSFDVNLTMGDYSYAAYCDVKSCRNSIVDNLKSIYDNIRDTSKFMIFAMVQTIEHTSTVARFRIYTGFGWGQQVSFNPNSPFIYPTFADWETEAPEMIVQAANSLYGYHVNGGYPVTQNTFFTNHELRNWRWDKVKWPGNIYQVNLSAGGIVDNYNDYYTFYMLNGLTDPLNGSQTVHDDLDYGELNFLTLSINNVLIHHTYAPSNKVFYQVGILPIQDPPTQWQIRYYWETMYYDSTPNV